jgi:hypothetical protein
VPVAKAALLIKKNKRPLRPTRALASVLKGVKGFILFKKILLDPQRDPHLYIGPFKAKL